MLKMQQGRIDKVLNTTIRIDGQCMTRKQLIDGILAAGGCVEIKERVDLKAIDNASKLIVTIRKRGEQNIKAEEIREAFKIINNPPNIKKYRLITSNKSTYDISKIEYDYAINLTGGG